MISTHSVTIETAFGKNLPVSDALISGASALDKHILIILIYFISNGFYYPFEIN